MKNLLLVLNRMSLVKQIVIGLVLGIIVGFWLPEAGKASTILGGLFVGFLKGIAPILVFFLVVAAIAGHKKGEEKTAIKPILVLYVLGTFLAALIAVIASFMFPVFVPLKAGVADVVPPKDVVEVLLTVVMNMADNPINAFTRGNYIGILTWAILFGFAMRQAKDATKVMIADLADSVSQVVRWVIRLAPFGVFGLVASAVAETGFDAMAQFAKLLVVLIGCMLIVALVVNPILVFWQTKKNPYPLVFTCLRESGLTAFFTRSSAANIPVNLALCKKLGVREETYSVSIPLGATINMAGAAITITVLTLAAVHTLGLQIDFMTAILLSILATVSACGASGVAGGSLLLIPLACSLFGISDDIAMQVVGVGFIIGVLQDSSETALNSSTDVLFTAAADLGMQGKQQG